MQVTLDGLPTTTTASNSCDGMTSRREVMTRSCDMTAVILQKEYQYTYFIPGTTQITTE